MLFTSDSERDSSLVGRLHRREQFSSRPARFYPSFKCAVIKPCFYGPIHHTESFSVNGDHIISASISCLIERSIPNAVIRTIASVIINPLNGMFRRRARPHVGVEIFKLGPTFTDGNTPAAVTTISSIVGIPASASQCEPSFVFRSVRHVVALAAGLATSAGERRRANRACCTAVATAKPVVVNRISLRRSGNGMGVTQNSPTTVSTARWGDGIVSSSQGVTSCIGTLKVRAALGLTAQAA